MSNAVVIKDLGKMEDFINGLDLVVDNIYQSQNGINGAFNKSHTAWNDQVSTATFRVLLDAGNKIERMNEYLTRVMSLINKYCQMLNCDYAGNRDWNARFQARNLDVDVKLEVEVVSRAIYGTTSEGIRSFEKELAQYIKDTTDNIQKVVREVDQAQSYWQDAQYEKTREHIRQFRTAMTRNLQTLSDELLPMIVERRRYFEEAEKLANQMNNIDIRG